MTEARRAVVEIFGGLLAAPRTTEALAWCGLGLGFLAFAARQTVGLPAVTAAIGTLLVLMIASLIARRRELDWRGLPPISLVAFLGWAGISVFWSQYQWATLGALAHLVAFTLIGVFIALSRDTIQIVRATGDVLRAILLASLAVEILSGMVLDSPRPLIPAREQFSGLAETSDALGVAAIIGAVTFVIEWRMKSVTRLVALGSLALSGVVLVFTESGAAIATILLVGAATAGLYAIRRTPVRGRGAVQGATLGLAAVGLALAFAFRSELLDAFGVQGELATRVDLWRRVIDIASDRALEGIGWIGRWNLGLPPYRELAASADLQPSAGNAYLDLFLQLGVVGVVLFCGLAGLAFVRSWLLASRRRTVAYAWPALVLVVLVIASIGSSAILGEAAWSLLVICCLKASDGLSWRQALSQPPLESPLAD